LELDKKAFKLGTSLLSINSIDFKSYELILRFKSDEYMKNSLEFYIYDTSNNISDNIDLTLKNYSDLGSGLCIHQNNNYFFNKVILKIYDEYTTFHNENKNDISSSRRHSLNIFSQIKLNNNGHFEEIDRFTSRPSKNSIFNDINLSSPIKVSLRKNEKPIIKSQKEIESNNYIIL